LKLARRGHQDPERASRPTRARGLKLVFSKLLARSLSSRPTRARGLKPF